MILPSLVLAAVVSLAPVRGAAPWANTNGPPPTSGRVTIVDVFTFECINCKHVTPELQRLSKTIDARDLTIIGVHAPELPEEKIHANVLQALKDQKITWPVVFDDAFRVWSAYGVSAWPTQLVFDRKGRLRATYVGEGNDTELERTVNKLVAERA
jgi:thiol-disulfide isomerase/thioredoxin